MIYTPITVNSISAVHTVVTETGGNRQIQNQLITPATGDRDRSSGGISTSFELLPRIPSPRAPPPVAEVVQLQSPTAAAHQRGQPQRFGTRAQRQRQRCEFTLISSVVSGR
jgi:hypothetical protein